MAVSPDGSLIAFGGASGYAHLMCGKQKTSIVDVKQNCPLRSLTFLSDQHLVTSGVDADVYVWDVRNTSRCLQRCFIISIDCVRFVIFVA